MCSVCSPGNPLSLVDLVPLLQKTLKDESSVTCKLACSAVRVRLAGHLGGGGVTSYDGRCNVNLIDIYMLYS